MSLHFNFIKVEATDAIKEHVESKVDKFSKYVTYPMEIHVFLSIDKLDHVAEIKCHAEHKEIIGKAKSQNLYESIDAAVTKVEAQLKKEREKRKGHQAAHKVARANGHIASDVAADIPHLGKNGNGRS